MSTYWYFECLDHTPPLRSVGEFTQHTDDDLFAAGVALAGQRPVEPDRSFYELRRVDAHSTALYFRMNASVFLAEHPKCRLGLVNEYGERRDLLGGGL